MTNNTMRTNYSPLACGKMFATSALCLLISLVLPGQSSAQTPSYEFAFPPGVDWTNATPEQISEAVYQAAKKNPDAAPDVAVAGLKSVGETGRFPRAADRDSKQAVDPDGSATAPSIEDMAALIADAAARANPALAPQIATAVAGALPAASVTSTSGGGTGGGMGGVPPAVPGGWGGGGGGGTSTPAQY